MRWAVGHSLAPELQSASAKYVAATLVGAIDELLKQERRVPELLAAALPQGIAHAAKLRDELTRAGQAAVAGAPRELGSLPPASEASLQGALLRERYRQLQVWVEALASPVLDALVDGRAGAARAALPSLTAFAEWERDLHVRLLAPIQIDERAEAAAGELTAESLARFLATCMPRAERPEIVGFERLVGGMSPKRLYRFDLRRATGKTESLIARHAPSGPLLDIGCFDLAREFELVKGLSKAGFLVPEPLWFGEGVAGVAGSFYVMRRVEGAASGGLFSEGAVAEAALLDMADQLGRLHSLPASRFTDFAAKYEAPGLIECTAAEGTKRSLRRTIASWRASRRQPAPTEYYLLTWALANVPDNDEPVALLHGDYTPHNCLVSGERLTAVLDWECAEFGDPAADLAYLRPYVETRMSWSRFLDRYAAKSGRRVSEQRLEFYANFFHLRTLVCANIVGTKVQDGLSREITGLHIDYEYVPKMMQLCVDATR